MIQLPLFVLGLIVLISLLAWVGINGIIKEDQKWQRECKDWERWYSAYQFKQKTKK